MALSAKQQAFVEQYLTCWNGAEAARRAGYRTQANVQGSRMLANASIQAAIQARLAELKMSADEVLTRITEHARGTMDDFLRIERITYHPRMPIAEPTEADPKAVRWVEDPKAVEKVIIALDLEQARDRGKLHLLKKYKESQWGPEIELHDPQAALQLLGRHHKLFVDRTELTGKDGDPIEVNDARAILADKLARRAGRADPEPDPGGDPRS